MKALPNHFVVHTHLNECQVGDNLSAALGTHLATRQLELEVGQLCPGELEGEPQQGGGQGSLCLRGESGGAANPGVGTLLLGDGGEVAEQQQVLVVGHLLVDCSHLWAEVQLLLGEQGQCDCSDDKLKATSSPDTWRASRMASRLSSFFTL